MGKYMRKSKASGEVAVMEVGGALLGVRTRSRTLLAQQQRTSSPPHKGGERADPADAAAAGDYLELRSRRLEKQPPGTREKDAAAGSRKERAFAAADAEEVFEAADDLEASFGDNVLDWDAIERSTRETTPCSLIRSSETMSTPGSATRASNPSHRWTTQSPVCHRYVPSSLEMEEFFDAAERQQHQAFIEKYNFCPANECPLPGRYEWARIDC